MATTIVYSVAEMEVEHAHMKQPQAQPPSLGCPPSLWQKIKVMVFPDRVSTHGTEPNLMSSLSFSQDRHPIHTRS